MTSGRFRSRKEQQIFELVVEAIDPLDHRRDCAPIARFRDPAVDHLKRRPKARQRIPDFVSHDRSELTKLRQGCLFSQLRFDVLPGGDVVSNRQVLARFAVTIEERDDGRIDPVERAVLGAVADLASPDPASGDRPPQLAHEFLGVMSRVDDAMVLPNQLVACVLRDFAELVVDVRDDSAVVGGCDDRSLIERVPELVQASERVGHRARRRVGIHLKTLDLSAGVSELRPANTRSAVRSWFASPPE